MLAWAYCVVPRDHRPPEGLTGIDGAPVRMLAARGLGLWASPLSVPPEASIERVCAHHDVVAAAGTGTFTPLPLRFGQCARPSELRRRLMENAREWRARMEELAGTVEFALVLVGTPAPESVPATTGREYLQRLSERNRPDEEAEAALAELRRRVDGLALMESVVPVPRRTGSARVAHLVHRDRADDYRARVQSWIASLEGDAVLEGPWPPWTFAA